MDAGGVVLPPALQDGLPGQPFATSEITIGCGEFYSNAIRVGTGVEVRQ